MKEITTAEAVTAGFKTAKGLAKEHVSAMENELKWFMSEVDDCERRAALPPDNFEESMGDLVKECKTIVWRMMRKMHEMDVEMELALEMVEDDGMGSGYIERYMK